MACAFIAAFYKLFVGLLGIVLRYLFAFNKILLLLLLPMCPLLGRPTTRYVAVGTCLADLAAVRGPPADCRINLEGDRHRHGLELLNTI